MNLNNPQKRSNLSVLIIFNLSAFLISACATTTVKQETISETESCNRLHGIIKDHPNQFGSFKKAKVLHKSYDSWTANKIIPSAQECQVWEWSTGLTNYACEWEATGGEAQAIANYDEASRIVQTCLGDAWTNTTHTTQSGGKQTIYSNANLPTVISIRYFKDTGGWDFLNSWYDSIIIGDKNNLKSPLN